MGWVGVNDLFETKPKSQQELVYEFIKSRGRILTHELNEFGIRAHINSVQSRARELKAKDLIWHIRPGLMEAIYPHSHEICWSVYPADK